MANRYWRGGSGTWNTSNTTNWSTSSGGAGGASVPTATDSVFFDQTGTYTVTLTGALNCLDLNISAGTITFTSTGTIGIAGSVTFTNVKPIWSATGTLTFNSTATTSTFTSNATLFSCAIVVNVTGILQLQDALLVNATVNLTGGTLDINNNTLTTSSFNSSGTGTRTIAFGTGNITITGTGTAWTTATTTGLTITGTPIVNISNTGSVATNINTGSGLPESSSISFNITAGTYALNFNASFVIKNLNFTGFAGTWSWSGGSSVIFGNTTFSSGMTISSNISILTFGGTSGIKTITTNSKILDFPITFDGVGGTWQLQDLLITGSTKTITLTNGTLDLNNNALLCGAFNSNNSNIRTLAFGTGSITLLNSGTVWSMTLVTGFTKTGTAVVNISNNTATAATIAIGSSISESNSISFNIINGTYTLSITGAVNSLNFTGFAGTTVGIPLIIYGNLIVSTGMTINASTTTTTFAATSGVKTITTNAKTLDFPITFNGIGGTWQLQDGLFMGSTRVLTHTNGTIDLNGKTLIVGTTYLTAAGTKNLIFNGGTLVCPATFNNAFPSGFSTTEGINTGKISMTSTIAKTFTGGGSTFNCTLSQDGIGNLTITGSNTFNNITNTVQPTSILFTAGTTNTFNNFNLNGTAGNLITIASVTTAVHTLLKTTGTVLCNYLSISKSNATGGAAWYPGANSINISGNSGWLFPLSNFLAFFL